MFGLFIISGLYYYELVVLENIIIAIKFIRTGY
jgi:hypothetical protein